MDIRTVLCPVDLTPLSDREVELASEVCKSFGARLVLLYNLAGSAPHMAKSWEWDVSHRGEGLSRAEAEQKLQEIARKVKEQIPTEACVTHGPVGMVLRQVAEELPADLMLMATHGWGNDDHDSLSERLLKESPCAILAIQEGKGGEHRFHLQASAGERTPRVLVPTDFSSTSDRATAYAFELARNLPLEVHLLHVARSDRTAETARKRLERMVPEDLWKVARCHIRTGDPADEIVSTARDLDVETIMMGEHARGLLRNLFTRDTARELLHRAPCAVWYVPARAAAA